MMVSSRPTSRYSNKHNNNNIKQQRTHGMTNATLSKQLPMQPPPVDDDNFNHAADPTARSPTTSECSDQRVRLSTLSCSALAAASGFYAFAAGRTERRSSSATSSPHEESNIQNIPACCAADDNDGVVLRFLADNAPPRTKVWPQFAIQHHIDLHLFSNRLNNVLECLNPSRPRSPASRVAVVAGGSFIIATARNSPPKTGQVRCRLRMVRPWGRPMQLAPSALLCRIFLHRIW